MTPPRLSVIACFMLAFAIGSASTGALSQSKEDAFTDAIRRANPENAARDFYVERAVRERVYRETLFAGQSAASTSVFVNTYGSRARYPTSGSLEGARKCTCYLPENMRGWNGGSLTQGEIVELCWRQCF
jgi:hypothetical protein